MGNTIASIKAVTGGFDCQLSGSKDEKVTVEKRFGYGESSVPRHPKWLQLPLGTCREGKKTDSMIRDLNLITVCESARCPNLAECFNRGTATFMILGSHCTRNCRFCAVEHGRPQPVDLGEPERLALAVQRLGLHYAVVTSVTRDDLSDGGASQFVRTIEAIRRYTPGVEVEVLIPDFKGSRASVESVCKAGPDMFNHNIETVPRLYSQARPQASFQGSLDVLAMAVGHELRVKSGMMLGLGETSQEIRATLAELRSVGCEYLTLGQYLAPSKAHIEPKEWLPVKTAKKNTHKSIQALCLLNFANTRQQGAIKEN